MFTAILVWHLLPCVKDMSDFFAVCQCYCLHWFPPGTKVLSSTAPMSAVQEGPTTRLCNEH